MSTRIETKEILDRAYAMYNDKSGYVRDPVLFLHDYTDPDCIEIAGLIASSLAYGRVDQIIKSVRLVIDAVGISDLACGTTNVPSIANRLSGFKHRFTPGDEVISLLEACIKTRKEFGSLKECFLAGYRNGDETYLPALTGFVGKLKSFAPMPFPSLLPDPDRGSACKRLNLFLRWMIRKDEIDPGPWQGLDASKLIVPLDTHMHRVGCTLGFTSRKQADIKTAIEITRGFKAIDPLDPVKFDFSLTHVSMENGSVRILIHSPNKS